MSANIIKKIDFIGNNSAKHEMSGYIQLTIALPSNYSLNSFVNFNDLSKIFLVRDHCQIVLLIISEFKHIKQLLFPQKSSENQGE